VKTFLIVGFLIVSTTMLFAQQRTRDSLEIALQNSTGEKKIQAYQNIITKIWRTNPNSAKNYALEAVEYANDLGDVRSKAIAVRMLGGAYFYLGKYDSSLIYTKQACKLSVELGDSSVISSSLSNLGEVYILVGSYPDALENLLQSLNIKRKINQTYGLANTLNHISLVYMKLKDFSKAKEVLTEAMRISEELQQEDSKVYTSNNLGFTYLYTGDLEEAERCFKQSVTLAEKLKNLTWQAVACSGLGQVYLGSNRLSGSREYVNKTLSLYTQLDDKVGISEACYLISKIHARKGNLDSAFYFVGLSEKFIKSTGSRERRMENFKLLEELYTQKGMFEKALFFKSRFTELRDSIFNESMVRTLANIEVKVVEDEAERELAVKDVLIQKKTLQNDFLIVIVLIVLIFSVVLYRSYQLIKQRTKEVEERKEEITRKARQLEEANNEIILKNEELEQQTEEIISQRDSLAKAQQTIEDKNKELAGTNILLEKKVSFRTEQLKKANDELSASHKELDHFLYRSSHDLKGPLARLLGLCHLGKMEASDANSKGYFDKLELTAVEMNTLLMKLINIHEITQKNASFVPVNLKNKLGDSFQAISSRLEKQGLIRLDNKLNGDATVNIDEVLICRLFDILIENSIQYRDTRKEVNFLQVTELRNNSSMQIVFADNGVGIQPEVKEQVFDMFIVGNTSHKGQGLGLYEAKIIVKKLKGEIILSRSKNGLTEFVITVPINVMTTV
jgi:signal transduction histidine kinase